MRGVDKSDPKIQRILRDFERWRANNAAREVEEAVKRDKQKLYAAMDEEAIFSITYVPYAVAEVAWDYVDTIHDYLKFHQRADTRKLNREVQAVRREYDRRRFECICDDIRATEQRNSERLQTEAGDTFARMHGHFDTFVREQRPDLDNDWVAVAVAAFSCQTIIDALYRFAAAHEKCVSKILNRTVSDMLPPELRQLRQLVGGFADGLTLTPRMLNLQRSLAEDFARLMATIQQEEEEDK